MPNLTFHHLSTPLLLVGVDPLLEHFENGGGFFEAKNSATTDVFTGTLSHIIAWELNLRCVETKRVSNLRSIGALPFVDVFQWPKKLVRSVLADSVLTL